MPNYCSQELKVAGEESELIKFNNQFKKETTVFHYMNIRDSKEETLNRLKESVKDFNLISDMNNEIIYSETQNKGYSFENFVPMPTENAKDWYNWRCENWGTKWDAIGVCEYENINSDFSHISYLFDTAWSPCTPVILAMSKQFPDLLFSLVYEEEGMCFAGLYECENGSIITDDYYEDFVAVRNFLELNGKDFYEKCPHCECLIYEYEVEDFLMEVPDEEETDEMECINCSKKFKLAS